MSKTDPMEGRDPSHEMKFLQGEILALEQCLVTIVEAGGPKLREAISRSLKGLRIELAATRRAGGYDLIEDDLYEGYDYQALRFEDEMGHLGRGTS